MGTEKTPRRKPGLCYVQAGYKTDEDPKNPACGLYSHYRLTVLTITLIVTVTFAILYTSFRVYADACTPCVSRNTRSFYWNNFCVWMTQSVQLICIILGLLFIVNIQQRKEVLNTAYQGYDFIFDGTPSRLYGLRICIFDGDEWRFTGGSEMDYTTDRAARSLRTIYLAAVPSEVLEFDLEVICERELNTQQVEAVKSWLFGHIEPKKLQIMRSDLHDVYFNCLLNEPEDIEIDGYNGWKFTVVCDAGGAWEEPKSYSYTPAATNGRIVFQNKSGNNDYTYPSISFTLGAQATEFSITNESDNNRVCKFTGLTGGETITVDGETKIITSSLGVARLSCFNKNFLRLRRGMNVLVCNGDVANLTITVQNFRRMGG